MTTNQAVLEWAKERGCGVGSIETKVKEWEKVKMLTGGNWLRDEEGYRVYIFYPIRPK